MDQEQDEAGADENCFLFSSGQAAVHPNDHVSRMDICSVCLCGGRLEKGKTRGAVLEEAVLWFVGQWRRNGGCTDGQTN